MEYWNIVSFSNGLQVNFTLIKMHLILVENVLI